MKDYNVFLRRRKTLQFFSGMIFIAILILGWFYPLLGYFIPLCMIIGIIIGLIRGRKWCDWYCPRGSFYDAIMSGVSAKKPIPPLVKNMAFRIGIIILLFLIMGINLIARWPSPQRIGIFFVAMLSVTTCLGIILAIIFHKRTWCMFCPIGTFINLLGGAKYPLKINSEACVECKLCSKVCPIQIKPYSYKGRQEEAVKERDCLKCASCVALCPKKALHF